MNVLLVDDNDLIRLSLSDSLSNAGMQVVNLADPNEALKQPELTRQPAVLVTDIDLGCDMNGFDLAVAARRRWPMVRIVYISGAVDNFSRHGLGDDERFVAKPFTAAALLRVIQDVIGANACPTA